MVKLFSLFTLPSVIEITLVTVGAFLGMLFQKSKAGGLFKGKITYIIPAHNEEVVIENTLSFLQKVQDPVDNSSIVVVADHCSDETEQIVEKMGVDVLVRKDQAQRGKGAALREGFSYAFAKGAEAVCVIDADTRVQPTLTKSLRLGFGQKAQALQVRNQVEPSTSPLSEMRRLAFCCINHVRPLGREFWGFSCGIFGNGFALTKDLLEKVPYQTDSIVEDVAYHHLLVEKGYKASYLPEEGVFSPMPESVEGRQTQNARWEGGRLQAMIHGVPLMLSSIFAGNWRVVEPFFDLFTLPLGYLAPFLLLLSILGSSIGVFGLCILFIYVNVGAKIEGINPYSFNSMQTIAKYIFWKVEQVPKTLRSAWGTRWNRTKRDLYK